MFYFIRWWNYIRVLNRSYILDCCVQCTREEMNLLKRTKSIKFVSSILVNNNGNAVQVKRYKMS